MEDKEQTFNDICWKGNWTKLPKSCGGNIQIWDQTVGCPECGMNLWHLPEHGQWPAWDKDNEPPVDWIETCKATGQNEYTPYFRLFELIHPFQFSDCHDSGDEDPS